jgi:hypothetical protein
LAEIDLLAVREILLASVPARDSQLTLDEHLGLLVHVSIIIFLEDTRFTISAFAAALEWSEWKDA